MTHITLSTFEKSIDSKILRRGKDYFKDDRVQEFEERDENEFGAVIEGSGRYPIY